MHDYADALKTVVRSRDTGRLARFLWEWGIRLANPRFLDMAGMPPADLRTILDDIAREDARAVFSVASNSSGL